MRLTIGVGLHHHDLNVGAIRWRRKIDRNEAAVRRTPTAHVDVDQPCLLLQLPLQHGDAPSSSKGQRSPATALVHVTSIICYLVLDSLIRHDNITCQEQHQTTR